MTRPTPKLEDLVDFPTPFTFRVMGEADETLVARCTAALEGTLGRPVDEVELRESAQGRFLAVRLGVQVHDADEIYGVYAALREVSGVRLVL